MQPRKFPKEKRVSYIEPGVRVESSSFKSTHNLSTQQCQSYSVLSTYNPSSPPPPRPLSPSLAPDSPGPPPLSPPFPSPPLQYRPSGKNPGQITAETIKYFTERACSTKSLAQPSPSFFFPANLSSVSPKSHIEFLMGLLLITFLIL